jgi:hypothetical protein
MKRRFRPVFLLLLVPLLLAACVPPKTQPAELLQLQPESAAHKAMQTRMFETRDDVELLSASAAVLQDLGFQVTESVRELGFLRAAKERSAREYGQEISRAFVALLSVAASALGSGNALVVLPVDVQQQIHASLVASPMDEKGERFEVRVLFYRLVWKGDGQSGDRYIDPGEQRMEMIRDAGIYQTFFARLSKAVFLEAYKI